MSDINWNGLKMPNYFADFAEGAKVGGELRQQHDTQKARNMFAKGTDDVGAERAMIAAGGTQEADAMRRRRVEGQHDTARAKVAEQAGHGDYTGARQTAVTAGDPDLARAIAELDDDRRAIIKEHNQTMASALYGLRGLPPEEQQRRWAAMIPSFTREGFKPEELEIDFTNPGAIDKEIADSQTVKEMIEAAERERHNREVEKRPVIVGGGAVALDDDGTPIYRNPRQFAPPRAPSGGGASLPPGYVAR